MIATLCFAILPYAALTCFVVGHFWRWRRDQFGWTTRTSQLLEHRWLALASPLFHVGALLVIAGHVMGLLIPAEATRAVGLADDAYHLVAVVGGLVGGALLAAGLVLLLIRRLKFHHRLRLVTTRVDWVLYALLLAIITIGLIVTFDQSVLGHYDYRETVSVWFRSLFVLAPDVARIAAAPLVFQLHIGLAFALIALWPFTRLVHLWSVPLGYLVRPYVVYRA